MEHRFNLGNMLLSAAGYKGLIYPGIFLNSLDRTPRTGLRTDGYDEIAQAPAMRLDTSTGTPLYAEDPNMKGRYYFMPVTLGGVEIPAAVIAITGQKVIQETPMPGASGSVKELIYADDWVISITGALFNNERTYPEDLIVQMRDLCRLNESVQLISGISDILFQESDYVVIKKYEFPPMVGTEELQIIKLECVTDISFELEVE